jgi:hypothetical protein
VLARPPQIGLRAERRSIQLQEGTRQALRLEDENSAGVVAFEGVAGAAHFAASAVWREGGVTNPSS